jgi:hypothetical protein
MVRIDPAAPQWALDFAREVQRELDTLKAGVQRFIGEYGSAASVPPADRYPRATHWRTDTSEMYYSDGTSWTVI